MRNAIRHGCEGAILTVRPSPDVEEMVRLFQNCHELTGRLLDSDPVHVAGK